MHIHIYISVYVYIHIYVYIYIHTYVFMCFHISYSYLFIYISICVYLGAGSTVVCINSKRSDTGELVAATPRNNVLLIFGLLQEECSSSQDRSLYAAFRARQTFRTKPLLTMIIIIIIIKIKNNNNNNNNTMIIRIRRVRRRRIIRLQPYMPGPLLSLPGPGS